MSLLSFLLGEKKKTASVAKERLQIILAHERVGRNAGGAPEYVKIDPTHLKVNVERQDNLEVLEVKIELPDPPVGKMVPKVAR